MEEYKVSVVIPTHNNADTIENAVMSVVNQDFNLPLEIVVVQDACTDKTEEIIANLQEKYAFIHSFAVNNRSVMATKIDGLKAAKGEYIMWLDGDDYYDPKMISTLYNKIIEEKADLVNGSWKTITKNGIKSAPFDTNRTYNQKQALRAFLHDISFTGYLPIKIYKRDLLLKVGLDSFPQGHYMYEDRIINVKYILLSNKIVCIKAANYYYNKLNENSITSNSSTRIQDDINASAYVRKCIEETGEKELLKIFRRTYLRNYLTLLVDFKLNHYKNKKEKSKIKKQAKKDLKDIYGKKPLEIKGRSYSDFILNFKK